jgi:hypothetical protein
MNRSCLWTTLRSGALFCAAFFAPTAAFPQAINVAAQSANPVISLASETPNTSATPVKGEASFANEPVNFHSFASARVGEDTYPEQLTLRFAASTMLTGIKSSKDFKIDQGSAMCRRSIQPERAAPCWFALRRRVRASGSAN